MNCDYGHESNEVRRLPIGNDDAAIFVCFRHWCAELRKWPHKRFKNLEEEGQIWAWLELPLQEEEMR